MASCTRRLFKDLAAEYAATRPEGGAELDVWASVVSRTAIVLKRENANFNTDKFLEACRA